MTEAQPLALRTSSPFSIDDDDLWLRHPLGGTSLATREQQSSFFKSRVRLVSGYPYDIEGAMISTAQVKSLILKVMPRQTQPHQPH